MKTKFHSLLIVLACLAGIHQAAAQGTAFTYQGRLNAGGAPASGNFDFQFNLFADAGGTQSVGGAFSTNNLPVSGGLFTTTLDFGSGIFTGGSYFLQISVRTNTGGTGAFTALTPLQPVTPTPYAIMANSASNLLGNAALASNVVSGITITNATITNAFITNSTFAGNGGGLTNLNVSASQLTSIGNNNGGSDNFFVGGSTGNATMNGSDNIAFGFQALFNNSSGSDNAAFGLGALFDNNSGSKNTATGFGALNLNTTGSDNTANGFDALHVNTTGSNNTAFGYQALSSTSGSNNIALGSLAGENITTGSSNIDIGNIGVTTDTNIIRIGTSQTAIYIAGTINGDGGGLSNLNASQLVSGKIPLTLLADLNSNYFSGPAAGGSITTGFYNTGYGSQTLSANTSGSFNTASGYQALTVNVSGIANTALGFQALEQNTNGADNTAVGSGALQNNNSGSKNTAIGVGALGDLGGTLTTGGSSNIAVGYGAGGNLTANESSNIYIGNLGKAGENNTIRIGDVQTNTFIAGVINFSKSVGIATTSSPEALLEIQGGADNTGANDQKDIALAYHSGGYRHWIRSRHNTSAVDNAIDFFVNTNSSSTASSAPGTGNVLVMTLNGGNVGIANAEPTHLLVVSSNGSPAYCDGTTWQNGSDRNSKEVFTAVDSGAVLEKVSALPITEWKYKVEADGTKHIGPMAQDFHAAFGLNGGDEKHIATIDEEGVALAAIQGLNQKLEEQKAESNKKDARIGALEKELSELKAAVKKLSDTR